MNALSLHRKDSRLIRVPAFEAERIFLGTEKLTDKKVDLLFSSVFHLSESVNEQLRSEDILDFALEVKESEETLFRSGGITLIGPPMEESEQRWIRFELNSDGPIILLTFCYELQYRHFKRNLSRIYVRKANN